MTKLHKSIVDLLDKKYHLTYIDYNDSLNDDNLEAVQKAIHEQDYCHIDESLESWLMECSDYGLDYSMKELRGEICREFEVDEDKAESFTDKYRDEIQEEIYNRDESNPLKDLIRNTPEPVCFYDTGLEIPDYTMDEQEYKKTVREIKNTLKITGGKWDKDIDELIVNASYGGLLVIYFTGDINDMMNLSDKNAVTFKNPNIAIVDHCNGSGMNVQLDGHKFTIPFTPHNIFLDKCVNYSYTYDVCGMSSDWCSGTDVKFIHDLRYKIHPEHSSLNAHVEREAELDATYKAGKCTAGDMNYNRHRGQVYINNFPCGSKCPHCGTFWID